MGAHATLTYLSRHPDGCAVLFCAKNIGTQMRQSLPPRLGEKQRERESKRRRQSQKKNPLRKLGKQSEMRRRRNTEHGRLPGDLPARREGRIGIRGAEEEVERLEGALGRLVDFQLVRNTSLLITCTLHRQKTSCTHLALTVERQRCTPGAQIRRRGWPRSRSSRRPS